MQRVYRGGIKLMFIYAAYMPLFLTVAEIGLYERKVSTFLKRIEIFDFFGLPCRNPWDDFYGSTPECVQVCALDIRPHLVTLK